MSSRKSKIIKVNAGQNGGNNTNNTVTHTVADSAGRPSAPSSQPPFQRNGKTLRRARGRKTKRQAKRDEFLAGSSLDDPYQQQDHEDPSIHVPPTAANAVADRILPSSRMAFVAECPTLGQQCIRDDNHRCVICFRYIPVCDGGRASRRQSFQSVVAEAHGQLTTSTSRDTSPTVTILPQGPRSALADTADTSLDTSEYDEERDAERARRLQRINVHNNSRRNSQSQQVVAVSSLQTTGLGGGDTNLLRPRMSGSPNGDAGGWPSMSSGDYQPVMHEVSWGGLLRGACEGIGRLFGWKFPTNHDRRIEQTLLAAPTVPGDYLSFGDVLDDVSDDNLRSVSFTYRNPLEKAARAVYGDATIDKLGIRSTELRFGDFGVDVRDMQISSATEDEDITDDLIKKRVNKCLFAYLYSKKKLRGFYTKGGVYSADMAKEHMLEMTQSFYNLNNIDTATMTIAEQHCNIYTAVYCAIEPTKDFLAGQTVNSRPKFSWLWRFGRATLLCMVGGVACWSLYRRAQLVASTMNSFSLHAGKTLSSMTPQHMAGVVTYHLSPLLSHHC